ncbi:MAG: helix-turn-helix domain-containing protein [bacterium]|nr:helix-turn-helix domain-containing protein [bacterium]
MGEKLKQARVRLGFSEKAASEETRIPVAVLTAFEADDFSHTGAYVYALGFLKRYCLFLGLDAAWFLKEFRGQSMMAEEGKSALPRMGVIPFFPFRFRSPAFIVVGCSILLLVGYFGINLVASYSSPALTFSDGGGDREIQERVFAFQGTTHPEADLTMNGRIVYLNESGEFQERVLLANGLNAFEFVVENKFGKITKIIRYIYVK